MNVLSERIKDKRFLDLIRKALNAGYMEFIRYSHSIAVTPIPAGDLQGSIVSPILANIFLNKLDEFIVELKEEFDVGTKATINPLYRRISRRKDRAKTAKEKTALHKLRRLVPSKLAIDPKFKKIEYIRYADD